MGKRSDFPRRERDAYATPYEAVVPLLAHLAPRSCFIEPCCGAGDLTRHLQEAGHVCFAEYDIAPRSVNVVQWDARHTIYPNGLGNCHAITNPPWSRDVLHPIIVNLSDQLPTWLLFDADWIHTKQAIPFLPRLRKVVSVGRVKWIADSKMTGKDNCQWHLFDRPAAEPAVLYGRAA